MRLLETRPINADDCCDTGRILLGLLVIGVRREAAARHARTSRSHPLAVSGQVAKRAPDAGHHLMNMTVT
jgi:hypothetical protein